MNPIYRLVGHLLDCRNATRLISQAQDQELSGIERLRLRLHLAACDACTAFERQMTFLREAMRHYRR